MGKLFICATPIGNLEDVTLRLLRTLQEVDLIACEDTRQTSKLLNHYDIKKRLISYHAHSDSGREEELLKFIEQGQNLAIVSDAGMPGISDPGMGLVRRAIAAGIQMEIIPGPSALTSALALSGFDIDKFIFEGFLSRRGGKRRAQLEELKNERRTIILYEAPHRLMAMLGDLEAILGGERQIAVARELTKKYEEVRRGTIEQVKNYFDDEPPRGEICLVISGQTEQEEPPSLDEIVEEIEELIAQGTNKKEALKMKARQYKLPKTKIYNHMINKK